MTAVKNSIEVGTCPKVHGTIHVPGDKSISHRVVMLSAISSGISTVRGFLASDDCINSLAAIEALGCHVTRSGSELSIKGVGSELAEPHKRLDLGNSGTGMRLIAGLLAGQNFSCELTGDKSLRSRPMDRIQVPLERMGAKVELLGKNNSAPIRITGSALKGIEYSLPMASAQVKSCILLASLFASGRTLVVEPKPTRDHTERMLGLLGLPVTIDGLSIEIEGQGSEGLSLDARSWDVPGDFSSAAYWITLAAATEGAELTVDRVGLNPRRTALLNVLRRMGADIETSSADELHWEPVGSVDVRGKRLQGTEVGGDEIPNLIDELPLVAVAGALADGKTVIRDAAELRVKESDRIRSTATNLSAMGVAVEELSDGLVVTGGPGIKGGVELDSFGDHRVAMSMAILGMRAEEPISIIDGDCAGSSYPGFWDDVQRMTSDGE